MICSYMPVSKSPHGNDVEGQISCTSRNLRTYSDTHILWIVEFFGTVLASVTPMSSIVALYFIQDMSLRLGMVCLFTVAFAAVIKLTTQARRVEVFAITAAVSAWLKLSGSGADEKAVLQRSGGVYWKYDSVSNESALVICSIDHFPCDVENMNKVWMVYVRSGVPALGTLQGKTKATPQYVDRSQPAPTLALLLLLILLLPLLFALFFPFNFLLLWGSVWRCCGAQHIGTGRNETVPPKRCLYQHKDQS
jgi:hypothetical protein